MVSKSSEAGFDHVKEARNDFAGKKSRKESSHAKRNVTGAPGWDSNDVQQYL